MEQDKERDIIKSSLESDLLNVSETKDIEDLKIKYLGKNGLITNLSKKMGELDNDSKKNLGIVINELKDIFKERVDLIYQELKVSEINEKLKSEVIDITLPATKMCVGSSNILEKLKEELEELFISMGYDVEEGPEVESDLYNFEMLNLPKGNPVRDAQDTFYIKDDSMLLRSQTSPVQIRTMLKNKDKTSIRIICPGKTYRRDSDDATHSHQFTQIEGLLVDKNISLADLKGTCDELAHYLFGNQKTRFRPSFYPFTEPSVEYDVECFKCKGEGCNICKNTGWITVGGAGMVHPNVLNNCGYDHNIYSGFAFGFGVERLAMLKYGISDIRVFYTNDLRSIKDFDMMGGSNED